MSPQSRQSARLSLQSSELAPPLPRPAKECCAPLSMGGGGTHSLVGEGRWETIQEAEKACSDLKAMCQNFPVLLVVYFMVSMSPRLPLLNPGENTAFSCSCPMSISLFSLMLINLKYVLVCKKFYCCLALYKKRKKTNC
jgi:hypothetical protein